MGGGEGGGGEGGGLAGGEGVGGGEGGPKGGGVTGGGEHGGGCAGGEDRVAVWEDVRVVAGKRVGACVAVHIPTCDMRRLWSSNWGVPSI